MPRYEDLALALAHAHERAAALRAVLEGAAIGMLTPHEAEEIEATLRELADEVLRLEAELRRLNSQKD